MSNSLVMRLTHRFHDGGCSQNSRIESVCASVCISVGSMAPVQMDLEETNSCLTLLVTDMLVVSVVTQVK